jgi:hypothetical protein
MIGLGVVGVIVYSFTESVKVPGRSPANVENQTGHPSATGSERSNRTRLVLLRVCDPNNRPRFPPVSSMHETLLLMAATGNPKLGGRGGRAV